MPIVVELPQSVTYQDQADLQKIYRDAPDWLFAPFRDATHLIETCLEERTLIAVRFNDRLLGAARLLRKDGAWELSQLCVRSTTRRRGLAHRLALDAQEMARHAGCELRLFSAAEPPEAQALAAKIQVPLLPFDVVTTEQGDA